VQGGFGGANGRGGGPDDVAALLGLECQTFPIGL
jgi:hypothetical protein